MQTRTRLMGWLTVLAGMALPVLANNIRVENVATGHQDTEKDQAYVAFDLSWENSWRNDVNWDAAWVFVKFRPAGSNDWEHAYLSTNQTDHLMPSGATVDVGTTEIAGTNRGMGVFICRNNSYTGDVNYANTRLLWKYGENGCAFSRGAGVELSVQAIEMVYVAEGAFYVGSGGTESGSFTDGSWTGGGTVPFRIESEVVLEIGAVPGKLWGTSSEGRNTIGDSGPLPAAFPKGYAAFYCMKYEITQGQYTVFLNMLPAAEASARFPNQYPISRHTIRQAAEDDDYIADAPDRACNYLSWTDGAFYAAWAGLRPMTELEFEKACRGPESPVALEYAWGIASYETIGSLVGVDGSGTETYNEGNLICDGSSPGGPVRVGVFATNGATRVSAGASYWGIMELSGNVNERAVSVGHATGRMFTGSHGYGTLTLPGDWPGTDAVGAGIRAGWPWNSNYSQTRVSNRECAALVNNERRPNIGGRAVRTAP